MRDRKETGQQTEEERDTVTHQEGGREVEKRRQNKNRGMGKTEGPREENEDRQEETLEKDSGEANVSRCRKASI